MRFLFLACSLVLLPVCLQQETSPIEIHQPASSPEAPLASGKYRNPLNRKQRSIFTVKLGNSLGFKQTALNLIFGKIYQAVALGTAKAAQVNRLNVGNNRAISTGSGRGTRPPPLATTTDEVPQFDRAAVRLDIPGDLVQVGYKITRDISKIIGSVFLNAADRKQQLVEAAKPYIAAKLGLDISPNSFTTQEPIESLVPRLGPPLGGPSPNASDTSAPSLGGQSLNTSDTSSPSPGGASQGPTSPPPEEISANRIDRSRLPTF